MKLSLIVLLATCVLSRAQEWIPFDPPADDFAETALDLRSLNEKFAGENGPIAARHGKFIHSASGNPVRFWAVNGPPSSVKDPAELRRVARSLAKRGVNLVRIHGAVFKQDGEVDPEKVQHVIDVVEAMKTEGIYTLASIYFPLWFRPKADLDWLAGYDGNKHPFAALMFNQEFQARYRKWWDALLTTPGARSGKKLVDEPALMCAEIQNEDSFFFWTFNEQNIPEPQLAMLERQFTEWVVAKHGSISAALAKWNSSKVKRDTSERLGFRPLWNIANERTARDKDTAEFLLELQTRFYTEASAYLRKLGFKGLITASNWATASPEVLGPLEKLSYTVGDFIDRHGYFSCFHKGDNAEWSIRDGHVYAERSALRFDPVEAGKPKLFVHPVMDPHYNDKPSMISETTFTRPNRFRVEAPLYYAAYGALQDSDAIVHFAFDGAGWQVKPNFWMQPWTLMSPAMMGQFPAAALIYRQGLVKAGDLVAKVALSRKDLLDLKGTPLPQDAAFDELRLKDVPETAQGRVGDRLDPLLHYVGRSEVWFTNENKVELHLPSRSINHQRKQVRSTTGELLLDYGNGTLTINAPAVQGAVGNLRSLGELQLGEIELESDLDLGSIVVVSLDGKPLKDSSRFLVQVMSEEQNSGWQTTPAEKQTLRITSIGRDPWSLKPISGTLRFKNINAKVTALDPNGKPLTDLGLTSEIKLQPGTLYYLVTTQRS
ncbi:MAG TPA: hypothetical protein VF773_12165 [Verrucomicrobiae bacterium]